jgi:3-methyladenine DNA glycosylase Tag
MAQALLTKAVLYVGNKTISDLKVVIGIFTSKVNEACFRQHKRVITNTNSK